VIQHPHGLGEKICMRLVLTLELHGEIEHRLGQKPAVGRELIRCHRSELAPSAVLRMLASLAAASSCGWLPP
jgi:uncharacterized ParB-like nuclease family protein